jgi:hypothetical protein
MHRVAIMDHAMESLHSQPIALPSVLQTFDWVTAKDPNVSYQRKVGSGDYGEVHQV